MTWPQLERMAAADNLRLFRRHGGVTIFTTSAIEVPFISITPGDLDDGDADRVVRRTTEAALRALKELPR